MRICYAIEPRHTLERTQLLTRQNTVTQCTTLPAYVDICLYSSFKHYWVYMLSQKSVILLYSGWHLPTQQCRIVNFISHRRAPLSVYTRAPIAHCCLLVMALAPLDIFSIEPPLAASLAATHSHNLHAQIAGLLHYSRDTVISSSYF